MITFNIVSITMWSLTGFCGLLTLGRYAIRRRVSVDFRMDDLAHLCAFGWLVAFITITQVMFKPTQRLLMDPNPSIEAIKTFCRLQTAHGVTFYLLHWTVKLAFLLFYRDLFWVSRRFIKAWWCVAGFVVFGLGVAFAGILTQRGPVNKLHDPTASLWGLCTHPSTSSSPICAQYNDYQQKARIYICAANVSTDLAVMVLPMPMILKLRIRKTQKLGLFLVFSVCLITIGLELFRITKNLTGDELLNNVLYAILNASLTIMVSCIPTYRSLWTMYQNKRSQSTKEYSDSTRSLKNQSRSQSLKTDPEPALVDDIGWLDTTYGEGPTDGFHDGPQSQPSLNLGTSQPAHVPTLDPYAAHPKGVAL